MIDSMNSVEPPATPLPPDAGMAERLANMDHSEQHYFNRWVNSLEDKIDSKFAENLTVTIIMVSVPLH